MTAPIFPIEARTNKYGPLEPPLAPIEKIKKDKVMSAPKYPNIERTNQYDPEEYEEYVPAKQSAQPMAGPKYPGIEESHKYGPVTERKKAPAEMTVPIYTDDPSNKYSF